ncbi:MAG: metallophosphoesterase [Actinomycetota bacterium]|nr:metallophosphoesterase [Actinomycetota bacterium]
MNASGPYLRAVSDLHVGHRDNREIVDGLRPGHPGDWLIVGGDVAERVEPIERTLSQLRERFAEVIWVPGNHELWTRSRDTVQLRGAHRYQHLVAMCRSIGVHTPEDPFPVWPGTGGPVRVAPLFLLYDYTFRAPGTSTTEESLAYAHNTGVVCTDERLLHPDPYPSREEWCQARVVSSAERLAADADPDVPFVLVNHWPLVREPTRVLCYPEFAQWCGTELTADWHTRFPTAAVVYGHLHIPRSTVYDGVPFEEVSLGYPREWRRRGLPADLARPMLARLAPA